MKNQKKQVITYGVNSAIPKRSLVHAELDTVE